MRTSVIRPILVTLLRLGVMLVPLAAAGTPADQGMQVDAVVSIDGQKAGRYSERTTRRETVIEDTVEQDLVLSRLGSQVEIRTKDVDVQDPQGQLVSGHFESSSSKTGVTTDLVVKNHQAQLTMNGGGKAYSRTLSFTGELLGPAGVRALLVQIDTTHQPAEYQTFVSALGSIARVSLTPGGRESLDIDGSGLETRKVELRVTGLPSALTLWVDAAGYTVRATQDTPFGLMEIRRVRPSASQTGRVQHRAGTYESTLAVSNIRLPHPRSLQGVTVEISARDPSGIEWPDFSSRTQRVLARSPRQVVVEVSRVQPGTYRDAAGPPASVYLEPNVLLQSDDSRVQEIAETVAINEQDPWKVALGLQRWVNEKMTFDSGIAIAPASEIARDLHGTCAGYAILLASLARARGIPARMRMGYVYDGKIWGGHAWVEVLIQDQWRPIDAAEYSAGIADAARIAVTTETGESGTIENVGELAKLYSKVDIRIVSYRIAHQTFQVARSASDYTIDGAVYDNPWLGLRVLRPEDSSFNDLDSHWPNRAVVSVARGNSEAQILYERTEPGTTLDSVVAKVLQPGAPREIQTVRWTGVQALRARDNNSEVVAAIHGDASWLIVASGPDAHGLLEALLARTSISEPPATPPGAVSASPAVLDSSPKERSLKGSKL